MPALTPQRLPRAAPAPVLAAGAFLKQRACLLDGDTVWWSPLHGDLSCPAAVAAMAEALDALAARASAPLAAVAHDLHPDFPSTLAARALAARLGVPAHAVQHHHAHLGVVMAEQGWPGRPGEGPVTGLALDGVGLGTDGTAWGGELLAARADGATRLAHLAPLAQPGGDAAAREPWRTAAAVLHAQGRGAEIVPRFAPQVGQVLAEGVAGLLARGLRCPPSTAAGRWFDAAAAALGLAPPRQAEAEAAVALERTATAWLQAQAMPPLPPPTLDLHALVGSLFDAPDPGRGAALFHGALAAGLVQAAVQATAQHGTRTLVLAGGCFHNRLLQRLVTEGCAAHGIACVPPLSAGCGDAGLALGQAWLATHARAMS